MRRLALIPLIALALAAGLLPLAALPAAAETCLPSGGAGMPPHGSVPPGNLQVLGRGWGHGVGMSQWGAQGAAKLGCNATQILTTYYPGTSVESRPSSDDVFVQLWPSNPTSAGANALEVHARNPLPWTVGGSATPATTQPQGSRWRVLFRNNRLELVDQSGAVKATAPSNGNLRVNELSNSRTVQLPQKPTDASWPQGRPYNLGNLIVERHSSTAQLRVRIQLPDVETYLLGLAEVPFSWELEAMKAQAIVGRSYAKRAMDKGYLFDSASDQVYYGHLRVSDPTYGRFWVQAVQQTKDLVVVHNGQIAQTYYSSSHGGRSENNAFSAFFSGDNPLPYLQPVDDTRWEAASNSPVATWAHGYSFDEAGRLLGVGKLQRVNLLPERGAGGRVGVPNRPVWNDPTGRKTYGGVEVIGTNGRKVMSGLEFVQKLGVDRRSELFDVRINANLACMPTQTQANNRIVTRSFGSGRVETAVDVAVDHWDSAEDVVLATAGEFADALSAAALAARLDAPILLNIRDELMPPVRAALQRLGAKRVHVMGGDAAISATTARQLREAGYEVRRIAGSDRFATASAAALAAGASPAGDVALALGTNWPDAVSAGSLAASSDRVPTLLTLPDQVPPATLTALGQLKPARVLIIGGTGVISDAVVARLRSAGYAVKRLSGSTRFTTSTAVARDALAREGAGDRPVVLASGEAFPDALTAGGLAARLGAPITLVPTCNLDPVPDTRSFLRQGPFDSGVIVGGTAAVSDRVRQQATDDVDG